MFFMKDDMIREEKVELRGGKIFYRRKKIRENMWGKRGKFE